MRLHQRPKIGDQNTPIQEIFLTPSSGPPSSLSIGPASSPQYSPQSGPQYEQIFLQRF